MIFLDPVKKAEIDIAAAVAAVDAWFAEQTAAGFTTPYGWKLGMTESDVTLLTGAFVLAKEADSMGLPLPPIVDMSGQPRALSMPEMTALMLTYGQARASLSEQYSQRIAQAAAS